MARMGARPACFPAAIFIFMFLLVPPLPLMAQTTELISVDSEEVPAGLSSWLVSASGDGRYVAFTTASALVPADTNGKEDVYVRDRLTGNTIIVSVNDAGVPGNYGRSYYPSLSANGRFVAFNSMAKNLHPSGQGGYFNIYVHDRDADGNGVYDEPGKIHTESISVTSAGNLANDSSYYPSISADGAYVSFGSPATNLVAGVTDGRMHVFLRCRATGITEVIDVSDGGQLANGGGSNYARLSEHGEQVVFGSNSSNLVANLQASQTRIYVRDRLQGTTRMVSINSGGEYENKYSAWVADINGDGRFVVFTSDSTNLDPYGRKGVFVHDRDHDQDGIFDEQSQPGAIATLKVDPAATGTLSPTISGNGRFITYVSADANLIPGDTYGKNDVFLHDRDADVDGIFDEEGATSLEAVSVAEDGLIRNGGSGEGTHGSEISDDGSVVAFVSLANGLVPADNNGFQDVFVRTTSGISVTVAAYDYLSDELAVRALSTYGGGAQLVLEGYGAMSWIGEQGYWEIIVPHLATPPASLTITGNHGSKTVY